MLFALKNWFGTRAAQSQNRPTTRLNVEALEGREVPAVGAFVKACPSDPVIQRVYAPTYLRGLPGVQITNVVRINPFIQVGPQPEPPTRFSGDYAGILLPSL